MLSSNLQKIIVVVIVVAGFGVLGYFLYSGGISFVSKEILIPGEATPVGQDILTLAQKLDSISLDQDIFYSPLFINLQDLSATVVPEVRGRNNPFAPIGVEGVLSAAVQPLLRVSSSGL